MAGIAKMIDHAALAPQTTESHVRQICMEAELYGFASVCVMPYWVPLASYTLDELGSSVPVCAAVGFPNGGHTVEIKVAETRKALGDGAREIDMVINVGALKSGREHDILVEIAAVAQTVHEQQGILKVILETSLLSDSEKRRACEIAVQGGADFVKTSTGFSSRGATVEDVVLMRSVVPRRVHIKASGGIRDLEFAQRLVAAGATRIGTSAGVAMATAEIEAGSLKSEV